MALPLSQMWLLRVVLAAVLVGVADGADISKSRGDSTLAWLLVLLAACSTMLGASLVCLRLSERAEKTFVACSIAAASGVMLYVGVAELFTKATEEFVAGGFSDDMASRYATAAFFSGCFVYYTMSMIAHRVGASAEPSAAVDKQAQMTATDVSDGKAQSDVAPNAAAVPCEAGDVEKVADDKLAAFSDAEETPVASVSKTEEKVKLKDATSSGLQLSGIKAAFALALHNFPEGMASYMLTYAETRSGMNIAFGIILHNIPEGLCVAMPIYFATKSYAKAFGWAAFSAAAELLGGALGAAIASSGDEPHTMSGFLFGFVNGLIIGIVCLEFIPTAQEMEPAGKLWPLFFLLGMVVIALTLVTETL
eukprot:TRINITY_DN18551_c0_g2_i1.p1 TRINITY_DN18551_c0_g2~~TRINITY_DN18551_c0_g2_i1.p1  ORF type:complete len:365 (+),score=79.76 TRINITY_DN18551_c0_g2_i1:92-1186(+)